jgi:hypothetical protein
MLNVLIALLAAKGVLAEDEAERLAKKLSGVIHPSEFKDARRIVEDALKNIKDDTKSILDGIDDSLHL